MSYIIPKEKRETVDIFIKECERQISEYMGAVVKVNISLPQGIVTEQLIRELVVKHFDIEWKEMKAEKKHHHIVFARQAYFWLMRQYTFLTLKEIARYLERDYTTVIHSMQSVENMMETKNENIKPLYKITDHIKKVINGEAI